MLAAPQIIRVHSHLEIACPRNQLLVLLSSGRRKAFSHHPFNFHKSEFLSQQLPLAQKICKDEARCTARKVQQWPSLVSPSPEPTTALKAQACCDSHLGVHCPVNAISLTLC